MTLGGHRLQEKRGPWGPLFLQLRRTVAVQPALVIRPLRMHWVHARTRLGLPFTRTRTVCKLGYQRRLVRLLAWLTLLPVIGPLPHTEQTRAITVILAECYAT